MSQDDTQATSDAADQSQVVGDDLDTNNDTSTGDSGDDTQGDTSDDTGGDDTQGDTGTGDDDSAGDEGGYKAKFNDQQIRASRAEGFLKAAGLDPKTGKPKKESRAPNKDGDAPSGDSSATQDEVTRSRLEARGVLHEDDQDYVMSAAKVLGVHPTKAIHNELVKGKLEQMRAARKTKDNTPDPTRRGGGGKPPKKVTSAWDLSEADFQKEVARIQAGGK